MQPRFDIQIMSTCRLIIFLVYICICYIHLVTINIIMPVLRGGSGGGSNEPHFFRDFFNCTIFRNHPQNPWLVVCARTPLFRTLKTGLIFLVIPKSSILRCRSRGPASLSCVHRHGRLAVYRVSVFNTRH